MASLKSVTKERYQEPSNYLFGIYTDDPDFPCASIIRTKGGYKLQTTDCNVSHLKIFTKQAVDEWMEKYFPTLLPEYGEWQKDSHALLHDENELIPASTVCASTSKIVTRYNECTLYAELDEDQYHFTFGGHVWSEGKSAPHFCEFSLRHIYIIDKAAPILFDHLGISDESLKKHLTERVELIKNWLDDHHEKPPVPVPNSRAGTDEKPEKIKFPLHSIITRYKDNIETLLTQCEYDAIREQIDDETQRNYEWGKRQNSGWDWVVADNGQIFVLYYGGSSKNILGSGGFSEVRLAQEVETGLWYAVKVQETVKSDNEKIDIEEFLLSQQGLFYTSAKLDDKGVRLSFEKILKAKPISAVIRPNPSKLFKGLSEKERLHETINIIKSLLLSVQSLHACGYLHRDIKMENILYEEDTRTARLIDFGSVEREDKPGTLSVDCHEVHPVTTNNYNAPELVEAREKNKRRFVYNELTDMYATGKVIGELIANYEGFDLINYKEDIMGQPGKEDMNKREDFMRYSNHWIKRFMPDCPITLKANDFFDEQANPHHPYASAMNHSSLRFLIEYAKKYPHKKDPQSQLYQLAAKCLATKPEERYSYEDALSHLERIKKMI